MAGITIEVQDLAPSKLVFDLPKMYGKIVDTDTVTGAPQIIAPVRVWRPGSESKIEGASTTWWARATAHPVIGGYRQLNSAYARGQLTTRSVLQQTSTEGVIEEYATLAGDMDGIEVNGWTCDLNIWGRKDPETAEVATLEMKYFHRPAAPLWAETLLGSFTTGDLTTSFANYPGTVTFTRTWGVNELFVIKLVGRNDGIPV